MEFLAPPGLPRLIVRPAEIEQVVGLSRPTVYRFERQGRFPKRRQLGSRATGWLLSELETWLRSRPESAPRPGSRQKSGIADDVGL
jgi:prophage regulatory protein